MVVGFRGDGFGEMFVGSEAGGIVKFVIVFNGCVVLIMF